MPFDELSDDHVAEILKRDAKTSSIRYTTAGLQAFLPKRPTSHAPKPNTRFLKSIIRETDNHNAAILAKEAKDSRLRLDALQGKRIGSREEKCGSRKSRSARHEGYDRHHRHRHGQQAEFRHAKRRRVERDNEERHGVSNHYGASSNHIDDQSHARDKNRGRRHHSSREEHGYPSELSDEGRPQPKRNRHLHHHRSRHRDCSGDSRSSHDSSSGRRRSRSNNHDRHRRRRKSRKSRYHSRSQSPNNDSGHENRRRSSPQRRHHDHLRRGRSTSHSPAAHRPSYTPTLKHKNRSSTKTDNSNPNDKLPSSLSPSNSPLPPTLIPSDDEDSDPLAAIIGPPPPPPPPPPAPAQGSSSHEPSSSSFSKSHTPQLLHTKGRGRNTAITSTSAIDDHFAPNYDPSVDLHPDSDFEDQTGLGGRGGGTGGGRTGGGRTGGGGIGIRGNTGGDDWDQALEALRDRQRWRQQGADRLLAAGFSAEEVQRWQKGSTRNGERDEEDVRWAKKGEGREWDRGKVVDEDGNVAVRAEWGRLNGTS